MRVDRSKALRVEGPDGTVFFCSEHCRDAYKIAAHDNAPHQLAGAGMGTSVGSS